MMVKEFRIRLREEEIRLLLQALEVLEPQLRETDDEFKVLGLWRRMKRLLQGGFGKRKYLPPGGKSSKRDQ